MISASRSASAAGLGVVLAGPRRAAVRGRGGRSQRVGVRRSRSTAPRAPARRRCGGRRRSPAGPRSARSCASSPGLGSTASISPRPKRSRSASRARSRALATTSSSSRSAASQPGVQGGVRRHQGAARARRRTGPAPRAAPAGAAAGAGRTGRARPPAARPRSASLDDRHRGAADPGARPALARDVAGQHDVAVLDLAAGLVDRGRRTRRAASTSTDALDPRPRGAGRGPCRCRPVRRAAARAR